MAHQMTLGQKQHDYEERRTVQALRLPRIMEKMTDQTVLQRSEKIAKLDAMFRKALRLEDKKPSVVVNVGLLSAPVPVKATRS